MALLELVKPLGFSTGDQLHPDDHADQWDANIVQLSQWVQELASAPFRHASPGQDTGVNGVAAISSGVMTWCPNNADPHWIGIYDNQSIHTINETETSFKTNSIGTTTGTVAWQDIVSTSNNTVLVSPTEVRYLQPTDFATLGSWSTPSGVSGGNAVTHDGTRFIIGDSNGSFFYSSNGSVFVASTNPTNWDAGNNTPAQIAGGKGPGGTADRVFAVPSGGSTQYFAYSDDNGVTWSEVTVAALTWRGVAYRAYDHRWVAVAQTGELYTSTNGGATWVSAGVSLTSGIFSKLWVLNHHFVGTNGYLEVVYAYDVTSAWKRGFSTKHGINAGAYWQTSQLALAPGRFGFLNTRASNSCFMRFSQAAPLDVAPNAL